jgi:predicted permease
MRLRDLMPWIGKNNTQKRWKQLEKKAVTLPVLFSLFFTKFIEIIVLAAPDFPMEELFNAFTMLVLSLITGGVFVYGVELEDIVNEE